MLSHGGIYHWPQGGFHVITQADHAKEILVNPDFSADRSSFFISKMPDLDPSLIQDFFELIMPMMVMSDGKCHSHRRAAAAMGIDRDLLERFHQKIEVLSEKTITQMSKKASVDFYQEIGRLFPAKVLADLFAIPEKDRDFFFECSLTMTAFFGGAVEYNSEAGIKVNKAACAIRGYFETLIDERKNSTSDDFISVLLRGQEKFGLSRLEIISQAVMMLVAGQVTTTDQMCNSFYQILTQKYVKKQVRDNPELLQKALEESFRFDPAVTFLFRVANKKHSIANHTILPGETVFISNHTVNRDPDLYDQPFNFDLNRRKISHFAFGYGPHFCLGSRLGTMQMVSLFGKILAKFPDIKVAESLVPQRDHYSLAFSGFRFLPLEY